MARIVETHTKPIVSCIIQTLMMDGTISSIELFKDDIVTDMRYIENGDVKTVTGRVESLNHIYRPTTRTYANITTAKSYFADDVITKEITIDVSSEYHSNVINIPTREIVENKNLEDVARMKYFLKYGIEVEVEMTDDTTNKFTLVEGQDLFGLEFLDKDSISIIDCRLIAINYDTKLNPTELIVNDSGKLRKIPILALINVGEILSPINSKNSVSDAIRNSTKGIVSLDVGLFSEEISIEKDIVIKGVYAGVSASNVSIRNDNKQSTETILSGKLNISEGVSVKLDGVTLTKDAYINLKNCKEISLENCRVLRLNPTEPKSFILKTLRDDNPIKISVKNCYFGPNKEENGNRFHNLFEMTAPLKDGSEFIGNNFSDLICKNNHICIYQVEDGATITIKDNVWEKSANGIRVGTIGDANCTINICNNTYLSTDDNPEWAGLLLVQPYGNQTVSMSKIKINLDKNKHIDKYHIYYLYTNDTDMQFDETNVPTIKIDGITVLEPK